MTESTSHISMLLVFSLAGAQEVLFYNRIGKAGSSSLYGWLSFNTVKSRIGTVFDGGRIGKVNPYGDWLTAEEEAEFVTTVFLRNYPLNKKLCLYATHVHYIDRWELQDRYVAQITMMRDPVDRWLSQFFYWRSLKGVFGQRIKAENKTLDDCLQKNAGDDPLPQGPERSMACPRFDYQARYFCGHGEMCRENIGFDGYLQAKRHMDYGYALVGIMEHFSETTQLIYRLFPHFFSVTTPLFGRKRTNVTPQRVKKEKVTERHRRILTQNLKWDMLLYRKACRDFRHTLDTHSIYLAQ